MPSSRPSPLVPAATSALAVAALTPHADAKIVGADLNFTLTTSDVVYLDFDNTLGHGYLHSNSEDGDEFQVGFRDGVSGRPYFRSQSGTTLIDSDSVYIYYYQYGYAYLANQLVSGVHTISSDRPMQAANEPAYLEYKDYFGSTFWGGGGTSSGYLGFSFLNGATNDPNYGFVEINYNDDANTLELVRFAYDDTGAGILAGASLTAVPEPSTTAAVMALVAGSAALFTARRRRAAPTTGAR
jgi:hypothetical protein